MKQKSIPLTSEVKQVNILCDALPTIELEKLKKKHPDLDSTSPYELFTMYFDEDMINLICKKVKLRSGKKIYQTLLKIRGYPGGRLGDRPPKTSENNFIHHDFLQFGKQHSRYKAILSSIVFHSSVVKYTSSILQ